MIKHVKDIPNLTQALQKHFGELDGVLDIGCGIRPFSWLSCQHLTCVEPFEPYRKILITSFGRESLVALKGDLLSVTQIVDVAQFDAVTLIDVIEHLPKEDGAKGIQQIIDAGAELFFVFTPEGFMPQHAEEVDAWGFNSGTQQAHLSGWNKEDFDTLGFTDYWIVDDLHHENGQVWNGLLAVYDHRAVNRSAKLGFWDPIERPNAPPSECERLVVFGRHNKQSGTVVGTHQQNVHYKYYIPSLTFAPHWLRECYKFSIKSLIKLLNSFKGGA